MKLNNHVFYLSLILTICVASSVFACTACPDRDQVNTPNKSPSLKEKAVNVYGSLFFSEEQLLSTEESSSSTMFQASDDSVNIIPALYYVLSDRIVLKAVYNKFILPISPEEFKTPQPRPSDSLTVGLNFNF